MRSILKDIDLDTLYRMRNEERMTNKEIADTLGISHSTVLSLIGKQPRELRSSPCAAPREKVVAPEYAACLAVKNRSIELQGSFGCYSINLKKRRIECSNAAGQIFEFDADSIATFIDELSAVKRNIDKLSLENEMW